MHHADRHHGSADLDDDSQLELPELPIPRPGEQPVVERAPAALAEPRTLGGGASFTSAGEAPIGAVPAAPDERQGPDGARFTWELAAQLTAGMLANPARSQSSVKDAMGLFDQLLQEMHAYTRIATDFDALRDGERRRQQHSDYFRGVADAARDPAPHPLPGMGTPRTEPTQPRPSGAYGHDGSPTGSYQPGSMAGPPPSPSDADAA